MKRLPSALLALLLPLAGHASMVLDRSILTFSPDKSPREDVMVYNPDPDPLFIKVEVLDVQNPGTDKEARVPVRVLNRPGFPGHLQASQFRGNGGSHEWYSIHR